MDGKLLAELILPFSIISTGTVSRDILFIRSRNCWGVSLVAVSNLAVFVLLFEFLTFALFELVAPCGSSQADIRKAQKENSKSDERKIRMTIYFLTNIRLAIIIL